MVDLRLFRKKNNLTQDELGAYLDMKKSFISKIENGREKMPEVKLRKLLDNDRGWDVSMLIVEGDLIEQRGGSHNIAKVDGKAEVLALRKEIELLKAQLEETKAEKAQYWEMIQRLTTR